MMKTRKIASIFLIAALLFEVIGFGMNTPEAKASGVFVEQKENVANIESVVRTDVETSTQEVTFSVGEAGEYSFTTEYRFKSYNSSKVYMQVWVDGAAAYSDVDLNLPVYWKMDEAIQQDSNGNDIRPSTSVADMWMPYTALENNDYAATRPVFYLEPGEHKATFVFEGADVELRNTKFYIEQELPSYEEYLGAHTNTKRYDGDAIVIQAENFYLASSQFITPQSDSGNPCTIPSDPYRLLLNTVGGSSWQQAGEEIVWNLDNVITEEGLYYISTRHKQNFSNGLDVYRTILVNGEVPFKEAITVPFTYELEWKSESMGYYFYLKPGDKLSFRVSIGDSHDISQVITQCLDDLNDFYSKITVITGTTPDAYFDYDIEGQIPNFVELARNCEDGVGELIGLLEEKYDIEEAGFTTLYRAKRLLKQLADKPRMVSQSGNLSTLKAYISEMGTLITTIQNQPVLMDSISFMSDETQLQRAEPGFFQNMLYRVQKIISSYKNDYSMVSGGSGKQSIKVWINAGRDQASIINEMILQEFTPKTGINVDLELVQTSLISANFAGVAPDVVLKSGEGEIINFAMRDALVDISKYEGFEELRKDYVDDAFIPFTYEDGVYGIPETMGFSMLFYRTDILEETGIAIPTTWEQTVNETFPSLSWYGKTFGVGAIGAGTSLFQNMLYQNGGSMYSEDLKTTALNTEEAFSAIQFVTKLYTEFDAPQNFDPMSRFRSGEMPIVIADYGFYNTLAYTCPELNGRWEMGALPGTLQADGTINNQQAAVIGGCFMFKSSKNKEAAWEFMKWWTEAEQQVEFGIKQETILGASGRYTPANLEALQQMPWSRAQLNILNAQLDTLYCVPPVPGNYYLTRCINNALLNAVLNEENSREQLIIWNAQINMELERKREEFDFSPIIP